jgi:peptidoglycan/xylan/chitin deacetylase (PgdA/CDA1 family)
MRMARAVQRERETKAVVKMSAWSVLRGSPLLIGMAALHALAFIAFVVSPGAWPVWILAVVAAHALIVALVLQPRTHLLGPNVTRLPAAAAGRMEVALTFDDGPDALVTPQVLAILDEFGVKASFFVVGSRLEAHPDVARDIVARGHSLENHTARHPLLFSFFGVTGLQREIETLQTRVAQICGGIEPRFFRPPAGFQSPLLGPVLSFLGLRLATWTRRGFDTQDANAIRVFQRLTRNLAAGDVLLLHDGNGARDRSGTPVVLQVLPLLLHELRSRGLKPVTLAQAIPMPAVGVAAGGIRGIGK